MDGRGAALFLFLSFSWPMRGIGSAEELRGDPTRAAETNTVQQMALRAHRSRSMRRRHAEFGSCHIASQPVSIHCNADSRLISRSVTRGGTVFVGPSQGEYVGLGRCDIANTFAGGAAGRHQEYSARKQHEQERSQCAFPAVAGCT